MSELPDFAVATSNTWFADGTALFYKHGGMWVDSTSHDEWDEDDFFEIVADAVVVALPTARPVTRDEAQKIHAEAVRIQRHMKWLESRDQGGVLEPGRNFIQ